MNKLGRPKKGDEALSKIVTLRFTPFQYQYIAKQSGLLGLTITEFIRAAIQLKLDGVS